MGKMNLLQLASTLPAAWKSTVVGRPGGSQLKVLRMDGLQYPDEVHGFDEALLVMDGVMKLVVEGSTIDVQAGEVYVVPAGQPHAVAAGSHGVLVIVDAQECSR
ncbi:MAG: cupin domain-containing protein [Acidovorax sp.]|nr:cupin domain-containing protein [Acidovorax sp.]